MLFRMINPVAWIALMACAAAVHADTLTGRIVAIVDGDRLAVLVARQQINVQLQGIDAPESRQSFGARSRQALSDLCLGKEARLETAGQDRYGRTIATVYCADRNANAEQVWHGMAWALDRNAGAGAPLHILEEQARSARRGLWSVPYATPPWEWRKHESDRKGIAPSGIAGSALL